MPLNLILYVAAAVLAGAGVGYAFKNIVTSQTLKESERKQKEILLEAKNEALKIKEEAKKEEEARKKALAEVEEKIRKREDLLDSRFESIEKVRDEAEAKQKEAENLTEEVKKHRQEQLETLGKIAKLNKEEAKELLLKNIEKEAKDELIVHIKKTKDILQEEGEKEARKVLATVIGRIASEQTVEMTAEPIALPSDELKGRIIGKEGRNIQAFEKATGVDLVIDDTPDVVVISAFDPVRRHIARKALERLISDGRIQPATIEQAVAKAQEEVDKEVKEAGEEAVYELSLTGLHPDLIKILGLLKFRTSYGQNVLRHSIEVAQVAGMLAAELGADQSICKKAGLFHDVGKAVDHEVPGAHHHISMDIARKYGFPEEIINAIGAHHDDIEPKSVEAILVKAADAISGSKPGARRESLEGYLKRLSELENIANSFSGVEKTYAIQAGREVRVFVMPEKIDDLGMHKLAKDMAAKIQEELQYPGEIKITVIRENRAVEYAR